MKPKASYFVENGHDITGVIHVGAHNGEEVYGYKEMGISNILCFEPLRDAYEDFKHNHKDVLILPFGLSDVTGTRTLHIAGGDGKGSSTRLPILDHPEVQGKWTQGQAEIIAKERAKFTRFDDWADARPNMDWFQYNCLVVDAQGMSLEVLQGFGEYLKIVKYLIVELSATPVYDGEIPAKKVIGWLAENGFAQLTPVQPHDDVLFIRMEDELTNA